MQVVSFQLFSLHVKIFILFFAKLRLSDSFVAKKKKNRIVFGCWCITMVKMHVHERHIHLLSFFCMNFLMNIQAYMFLGKVCVSNRHSFFYFSFAKK